MKPASLRRIPAVEKVLVAIGETGLPRPMVVAAARRELAAVRREKSIPDQDSIMVRVRSALDALKAARIRPLINGTRILAHTNFGRAPLGSAVIAKLSEIGSQYNNIEYALADGVRRSRAAYLEQGLALLCGAEAATVVNNNAAALVLILSHFCGSSTTRSRRRLASKKHSSPKNEVVISRGELIQIGGGFRIPEILEASGAVLKEVGTTNKTTLADFAHATSPRTALILKVHRSNFFMKGFVASPTTEEISVLARKKHISFVEGFLSPMASVRLPSQA